MRLNKKSGGFLQDWPTYVEVPKAYAQKVSGAKEILRGGKSKQGSKRRILDSAKAKFDRGLSSALQLLAVQKRGTESQHHTEVTMEQGKRVNGTSPTTSPATEHAGIKTKQAEPEPKQVLAGSPIPSTVKEVVLEPKSKNFENFYKVANVKHWDVLNMRSGPHHTKPIVERLAPSLRCVKKLGDEKKSGRQLWWKIKSPKGNVGWVNSSYLRQNTTGCPE